MREMTAGESPHPAKRKSEELLAVRCPETPRLYDRSSYAFRELPIARRTTSFRVACQGTR